MTAKQLKVILTMELIWYGTSGWSMMITLTLPLPATHKPMTVPSSLQKHRLPPRRAPAMSTTPHKCTHIRYKGILIHGLRYTDILSVLDSPSSPSCLVLSPSRTASHPIFHDAACSSAVPCTAPPLCHLHSHIHTLWSRFWNSQVSESQVDLN
jgi:hypothetical protein